MGAVNQRVGGFSQARNESHHPCRNHRFSAQTILHFSSAFRADKFDLRLALQQMRSDGFDDHRLVFAAPAKNQRDLNLKSVGLGEHKVILLHFCPYVTPAPSPSSSPNLLKSQDIFTVLYNFVVLMEHPLTL